jgi:hypothetical protein
MTAWLHYKGTSSKGKDKNTQTYYRDQSTSCPVDTGGYLYGGKTPCVNLFLHLHLMLMYSLMCGDDAP